MLGRPRPTARGWCNWASARQRWHWRRIVIRLFALAMKLVILAVVARVVLPVVLVVVVLLVPLIGLRGMAALLSGSAHSLAS